jgi:hypothetical protein
MFPLVKEFRGHRIERRAPGFEFTPVLLGKITTYFVVLPDKEAAVFAFMYSFLITGRTDPDEEELARLALDVVEAAITAGAARGRSEHTHELDAAGWQPVADAKWWISLRT